jgi:hypothetical protein
MTAVTLRGTFKKDSRPSNGLEEIADELIADKARMYYVVGVVKWAGGNVAEEADILDKARRARQLGRFEDEHPAQMQIEFDFDGKPTVAAETRLGQDGEHVVPEASGEEILAERAEAKAAKAKPSTAPFKVGGAE